MKKTILSLLSACVVLTTFVFSMVPQRIATAQSKNLEYYLVASQSAVSPGTEFDVAVKVKNPSGTKVKTAGFALTFDAAKFEIVDDNTNTQGIQIAPAAEIDKVVENTVGSGSIKFTGGTTTLITATDFVVATMKMKVKDGVSDGVSQLVFSHSPSSTTQQDTSILGESETTELLSATKPLDITISGVSIEVNANKSNAKKGDDVEFTIVVNNPGGKSLMSVELQIAFDTKVFTPKSSKILTTSSDFGLKVDDSIANGIVNFTGGNPANADAALLTKPKFTVGTFVLTVTSTALDGKTDVAFKKSDSSAYLKDNATANILGGFKNASIQIGESSGSTLTVRANPKGGNFTDSVEVKLSSNRDATIYYTTNRSEPDEKSRRYKNEITLFQTTTLKFIAIASDGTKSSIESEKYTISSDNNGGESGENSNLLITLEASKTNVAANEKIELTATLKDKTTNQPIPDTELTFSQSGKGTMDVPETWATNAQGQVKVGFTPQESQSVTATLKDDTSVASSVNITVGGAGALTGGTLNLALKSPATLSTTQENIFEISGMDASGSPLPDGTEVVLILTEKSSALAPGSPTELRGIITNGKATIIVTGSSVRIGNTYSVVAQAGGLTSNTLTYTIPNIGGGGMGGDAGSGDGRSGGGSTAIPNSGPETLLVLIFISFMTAALIRRYQF